ncbi:MAG: hypothetical protein D6725_10675, partial [Planctomycetota bacterium]
MDVPRLVPQRRLANAVSIAGTIDVPEADTSTKPVSGSTGPDPHSFRERLHGRREFPLEHRFDRSVERDGKICT